jgi:hypothetical protein
MEKIKAKKVEYPFFRSLFVSENEMKSNQIRYRSKFAHLKEKENGEEAKEESVASG